MDNFNTTVNALTEGLRELPTDFAARVKNFLAEYLGDARHPVPFGGRARDFEQLDAWLTDLQAPPYLLLAAPAGRGKSALLLRWCQSLLARPNLAVAYFPVSIRFRTNLAGVVFPALVALLANLHGEKLPADPNVHEEVWRGLLADYMTRPLPDGRSLVLVLDGVDEAADWAAGPGLFPSEPPAGLRVVLSARYLANDHDAAAWLERLDWASPGLARTLPLYPLDRTGIASVLIQMGFPLDLLGTRVNIVSELHRLSEGDPLLVRLYVDDLWERGEAAVRFQPEDLHAIRPGLAGYFERWWKDQRLLWSQEAPEREAAAQTLLNLLAGALGPLSKDDILSLAPDEAGFKGECLAQHLASLSRFVIGDGMRQGYVFSHPRLGNYFLEEYLGPAERRAVEERFLSWGAQTLAALNEGRLSPEKASAYIVQYYGAHLQRAQADAPTLLSLVSDGWRRAWEKLDRANAGFLGDVERAWRAAEREDTAETNAGRQAPYLGAEIRSLLCRVSVNSMTSNISPRLMLEAVKTGVWTPAQGLACIRLITDQAPRARELVDLAPYVQEPLRTDILQEALDTVATIKDEYDRLDTLVELAPGLSADLLWQVLETVPAIGDEADRAGVLSELSPVLARFRPLLERALHLVQEIEDDEYRALALEGLVPRCSQDQHDRVLQLVETIQEERYRAPVLTILVPLLSPSSLLHILQGARVMRDGLSQVRLLTELVAYLPAETQTEVVQEVQELLRDIEDREYRVEALVKLAPFLPDKGLQEALQEIQLLWDESYRARSLIDLIPYVPEEQLASFLQTVRTTKSEEYRTGVLMQLVPRLPHELLEQTLDIVETIWDEGCRAEILARLAPYASQALLPRLMEIVATIEDHGYSVWLLAELEAPLAGNLKEDYVLSVFRWIERKEDRLQTLLAVTPRLSEKALAMLFDYMLPDLFGFGWSIRPEDQQAYVLTKLAPRLPAGWLPKTMDMVRALSNEAYQAQVLVALAPRIRETLLSKTLDLVRAMKDRSKRAQVLEVLVASLPEERKGERVQEMLQVLQVIKDEAERAHVLFASSAYLPAKLPFDKARVMLEAVRAMRYEGRQARVVEILASRIPEELFGEMLGIWQETWGEEERAHVLETLAPHVPERFWLRILRIVQAFLGERWRARALITIAPHAPQDLFPEMLVMALSIDDEREYERVLEALAPYAPKNLLSELWEAVRSIRPAARRARLLGILAVREPGEYFPPFWRTVLAIEDEGWQAGVLKLLAPHMAEDLFALLWEAVQSVSPEEKRVRMMEVLAPHVPERFFAEFFTASQAFSEGIMRLRLLSVLAPHAPEPFFPRVFSAVRAIPDEGARVPMLESMAPHVPEGFFPHFFIGVRDVQHKLNWSKILVALAPHVPEDSFAQFLQAVEDVGNEIRLAEVLKALAPHIPRHFFPRFWKTVRAIQNGVMQMQVVKALIPYLPQERHADVLELIQSLHQGTLPFVERRVAILETLIPHLSPEQCVEVLGMVVPLPPGEQLPDGVVMISAAWMARDKKIMAVLVPYLPEDRLRVLFPAMLKAVQAVRPEEGQLWMLTRLAVNVPEEFLSEMLETIWSINLDRSRVLAALLPSLSATGWAKVLELTAVKTYASGDPRFMLQVLKAGEALVEHLPPALLYPALQAVLQLDAERTRLETLADLAQISPVIHALGGEAAVTEACCATLAVGHWWP